MLHNLFLSLTMRDNKLECSWLDFLEEGTLDFAFGLALKLA